MYVVFLMTKFDWTNTNIFKDSILYMPDIGNFIISDLNDTRSVVYLVDFGFVVNVFSPKDDTVINSLNEDLLEINSPRTGFDILDDLSSEGLD
jgi:hypothetical protein